MDSHAYDSSHDVSDIQQCGNGTVPENRWNSGASADGTQF